MRTRTIIRTANITLSILGLLMIATPAMAAEIAPMPTAKTTTCTDPVTVLIDIAAGVETTACNDPATVMLQIANGSGTTTTSKTTGTKPRFIMAEIANSSGPTTSIARK